MKFCAHLDIVRETKKKNSRAFENYCLTDYLNSNLSITGPCTIMDRLSIVGGLSPPSNNNFRILIGFVLVFVEEKKTALVAEYV